MRDLKMTNEEEHLEVLARHGLDVEKGREIVRRVEAKMAEEGTLRPMKTTISVKFANTALLKDNQMYRGIT